MNNHQFKFEERTLRTSVTDSGEPLFVAKDVCEHLDISNHNDAVARLDDDEKGLVTTDTLGGPQKLTAVTESGLYVLIFASRKPEAKRFRKWVTSEVLPALRKQGIYRAATPGTIRRIDALRLRLEAAELRAKAQHLEALARGDHARPEDGGVTDRPEGWLTVPEFVATKLPETDWRRDSAAKRLGWALRKAVVPRDYVRARTGNSLPRRVYRPDLLAELWPLIAADMGITGQLPGLEVSS